MRCVRSVERSVMGTDPCQCGRWAWPAAPPPPRSAPPSAPRRGWTTPVRTIAAFSRCQARGRSASSPPRFPFHQPDTRAEGKRRKQGKISHTRRVKHRFKKKRKKKGGKRHLSSLILSCDCIRLGQNPGTQSETIPSRFHSQFPTLAVAAAAASRVLTGIASLLQSVRAYYRGECGNMTVELPCLRAALCPLFNELIKVISHEATQAKTEHTT